MVRARLVAFSLLSACAAPHVVMVPPANPPPSKPIPVTLSLTAKELPRSFVVDGDLGEWGDLQPGAEVVTGPEWPSIKNVLGQGAVPYELENAPNPKNAGARVALAITPDGVRVAADLGDTGARTLTLGLATFDWPALARSVPDRPAEVSEAFVHRLRVREGTASVALLVGRGEKALAGARVVWSGDGTRFEASLPNAALPQLVDAPVVFVRAAAALEASLPQAPHEQPWRWLKLPSPVAYEPHAELRAKVIAAVLAMAPVGGSTISYRPDDPLGVFSAAPDPPLSPLQPLGALYEKKASVGDVDVGLGYAHVPYVVALNKGRLSDLVFLIRLDEGYVDPKDGSKGDASVQAILTRNDEVHVVGSTSSAIHALIQGTYQVEHWTVVSVGATGKARTWRCEVDAEPKIFQEGAPERYADAGFTRFGWRNTFHGSVFSDDKQRVRELACTWDAKAKTYEARTSFTPPLPPVLAP
ncbi:MAG: hypothetical protein HY908_09535 [Myxococcales bacterium]|nr:hypothetical protein [Myxococcales bacterium]